MNNLEKLLALGAEVVAGDVLWKHKHLGTLRNGDLTLTEEGVKALDIVDVEVKQVVEPTVAIEASTTKRGRKKVVEVVEVVEAAEQVVDAEPAAE
jgi:hypothetical protein